LSYLHHSFNFLFLCYRKPSTPGKEVGKNIGTKVGFSENGATGYKPTKIRKGKISIHE
jgi:hypothetical protein